MTLRELNLDEIRRLYREELLRTFPPSELKPLKAIEGLYTTGRYQVLGAFEEEELLGYALMWLEPGIQFALLDYLGTVEGKRNGGVGAQIIALLGDHYAHYRGVFGEAEGVFSSDPEEAAMQARRLGFYERNGFRYGGYDCALYGVHYQTLIRGDEDVTAEELLEAHQAIYKGQIPPELYRRFIQIPLAEGEEPNPVGDWVEE